MENSRNKLADKVILLAGIIIFLALTGGSVRKYQEYRRGVDNINKIQANIVELQSRKERLEKLVEETKNPEFVEKQLREKLGLVKEGEEYVVAPTSEPKLVDLRMEEPAPRKTYWREWWGLVR